MVKSSFNTHGLKYITFEYNYIFKGPPETANQMCKTPLQRNSFGELHIQQNQRKHF